MVITILMICYTLLSFGIGYFAFSHRQRPFLVFHPEEFPNLSRVLVICGSILMAIGVLAAIATIMNNTIFISLTLLAGVIAIMTFQLMLLHWFPKR